MDVLDLFRSERNKWKMRREQVNLKGYAGLPQFDSRSRDLYELGLPRNVLIPRLQRDREKRNFWMSPHELCRHHYVPGQLILGKLGGRFIGHMDDRPVVTIAGARAGKTSTVLEPNLYLYGGSMLVLDPKGELARLAASLRRAMGHNSFVLDAFGQSGETTACYNPLDEFNADDDSIIDDIISLTQALIVDGDERSRHWTDSARMLLGGIILLTLTLDPAERNLITVRQLLTLTYAPLLNAVKRNAPSSDDGGYDEQHFSANNAAMTLLFQAMMRAGDRFGGVLAAIGSRFKETPPGERGSIFSTSSAQTDFLDSLPLRKILRRSDFSLRDLRGDRPTTVFLCLPVGRMESHYRWLRMIVQMACTALEQFGPYPRDRTPILFMMEEFATLGHMEIMERAAAYFPGFGIKLHACVQDTTQLQRYYQNSWETFLGNAGAVQSFANGDEATLRYLAHRLDGLIAPSELRIAFSRERYSQLILMEGLLPAATQRLEHADVTAIREALIRRFS